MSRKNKNVHNGGGNGGGVGMFGGMGFLQTIPEADVESSRGGGDGDSCSVYSMTSRTSQFTQGTTHTSRTPQTSNLSGTTSSSGHAAAGGAPVPYSSMEHPHPNHPPRGSSANGGVGGGVGTSVDTVRNNSLKRWWHVMGTSSNRDGSSRAGSVASSGFQNEEPVVNGGPIDVDSGARTHYNVTFSAGGGGSVNAVVDASGSVVSELTDQRKTHPDQSVDGSNCGGNGGGGGNGPAVKRSFRDRMKEARRCNRAMAIHGLLCVGIFLAIVVGLSVYFTLDSTKARGGGGAAISQTVDDDDNVPDVEVGDAEWEDGASWPGGIVNAEPTSTPAAQPTAANGSLPAQQPTREPQDWKDKDKGEDCKGGNCGGNKPTQEDDDVPTAAPQEQEWTVKTSSPVASPTPPVPSPTTLPPVATPPTPPASTPTSANADGGPSYQAVLNVLSSVSSPSLLADPSTPQGFAANWIARGGGNDNAGGNGGAAGERDGLNLELDVGQTNAGWDDRVVSERRYKQRYALAVLHKALAGPRGIGGNGGAVAGGGGRDRRDRARERNRRLSAARGPEPGRKKARRRLLDEDEATKQEAANAAATTKHMRGSRNMQITVEFGTHDPDGNHPEEGADHVPPVVIEDGQNRQNTEESSRWLSPNDECLWAGITCRSVPAVDPVTGKYTGKYESVVVGVVLDSSDLAGELPEEIGTALTSLQELTLYSNAVTGQIPESLTTLRDLYYLDLGSNRFNGRVPLFGPDLEYLYLNENDLSGPLPSPPLGGSGGGGGRATTYPPGVPQGGQGGGGVEEDTSVGGRPYKLKHLWVDRNDLSGEMPEGIARFEALESFIIYGNRVSSTLPETISALSELRYLDVSYNEMFGSLPYALYELSSLDHLYLTSNNFSGSLSASVERLVNLEYLWMDSNEFTGPVPETLAKLSRLRSLLLQDNKISGVVPQLVCGLTTTSGGGTLEFLEADCDASGAFERNEKGRFSDGDEEYYYYVECECCTKCYPEAAADGEEETP